jgi:hypothetical protein
VTVIDACSHGWRSRSSAAARKSCPGVCPEPGISEPISGEPRLRQINGENTKALQKGALQTGRAGQPPAWKVRFLRRVVAGNEPVSEGHCARSRERRNREYSRICPDGPVLLVCGVAGATGGRLRSSRDAANFSRVSTRVGHDGGSEAVRFGGACRLCGGVVKACVTDVASVWRDAVRSRKSRRQSRS